jgi:hypothetical protein
LEIDQAGALTSKSMVPRIEQFYRDRIDQHRLSRAGQADLQAKNKDRRAKLRPRQTTARLPLRANARTGQGASEIPPQKTNPTKMMGFVSRLSPDVSGLLF